jgi:glycosyltransferase involved in cell wall biosynthesis
MDPGDKVVVLINRNQKNHLPLNSPSLEIVECDYAMPSLGWLARGIAKNIFQVDPLTSRIDRMNVDVIHHPFSILNPRKSKLPTVLTLWDLQHEFYPEYFARYELSLRRRIYRSSAEDATRVIVSADFTRTCLVERYAIDADKIDVIPLGYGQEFAPIDDEATLDGVRRKYNLSRPFMYYPAATWPHKNHERLFAALRSILERCRFDGELVLSGIAVQSQSGFRARIENAGLASVVKVLGYVPYEDLPYLYNLARILVFPSLFEGFGIPIVEAMACGCPVLCSNVTSLPEVVGEAGVLFDPSSSEDMAENIWSVWNSPEDRRSMRAKGLERVKAFRWEETAGKTLDVYRRASGK